eukprot:m.114228 g.114228  ORF g.114228 m.114228 type:complete len:64 (-) comp22918_c0_seq6:2-193(-)
MRIRVVGLGANYHHQLQGPCHWVSVPELLCGWATLIALDHGLIPVTMIIIAVLTLVIILSLKL